MSKKHIYEIGQIRSTWTPGDEICFGNFLMNGGKSNLLKIIFKKYEITFVHFVNHVIPLEFGNKYHCAQNF